MTQALRTGPGAVLKQFFGVPFRRQTYRNIAYLALAFPLGLLYFVFLSVGLSVGVALVITVIGVPVLLVVLAVATGLATVERKLTALLLGVDIAPPAESPLSPSADRTLVERAKALVASVGTWKAVFYLASKLALGVAAFVLITTLLVTAVTLLVVPFVYDQPGVYVGVVFEQPPTLHPALAFGFDQLLVGVEAAVRLSSWEVSTLPEALAVALLGVGVGIAGLNLSNALAWLSGRYARFMLGGEAA